MSKRPQLDDLGIWRELGASTGSQASRPYRNARLLDLELIRPDPNQPRRTLEPAALQELAESIKEYGLLQPILIRPDGDGFVIIAGHRRYEAARLAGLARIPVVVREETAERAVEQALIENVQREDINPVEEAQCYQRLMGEHGYSVRDMAAKVHKSVGYLHSRLELLKYPDISQAVTSRRVGVFEARELARVRNPDVREVLLLRVSRGELDRNSLRREVEVAQELQEKQDLAAQEARHEARRANTTGVARSLRRHARQLQQDFSELEPARLSQEERAVLAKLLRELGTALDLALGHLIQ